MTIGTMPKNDILIVFGRRVRALRKDAGWSQEEFADEAELDRTYIGGVERGERNLALRNIHRIAQTFDMTIAELMDGVK